MKYKLTLTKEQAQIVSLACEFYARIKMGQFQEIPYHLMMDQPLADNWCERRDAAETYLLQARKMIYPELGGYGHSYGLGKFEDADMAFDVHQVIRHKFGDKRPPFSYHELPICEEVD